MIFPKWIVLLVILPLGIEIYVSNLPLTCNCYRIQPVYVVDVASALTTALKDDGTSMGKIYELGGPEIFTVHELVISDFIP
jgi:uncharacterized protein YbjT (DUF2867 family)